MLQTSLRHHELVFELTLRKLQRRYQRSFFNVGWSLVPPLSYLAVLTFVFSFTLHVPSGDVPYPLFVYVGLLPWLLFAGSLQSAAVVLVQNAPLIKKIYFPRELFVVSAVLARVVEFVLALLVLGGLYWYFSYPITWTVVWVPSLFLLQLFFIYGLSLLVSGLNLFYRNVRHFLQVLLFVWLFVTPVMYPMETFPSQAQGLLRLNPMAALINSYREVLLEGRSPSVENLGVAIFGALLAYGLGYIFFKRVEGKFADVA
jgi:lipopolysaccharide transport system permease protein